nr:RHS repeat-associated core domain-containing protein [uncultured Pseudomonas sp.]
MNSVDRTLQIGNQTFDGLGRQSTVTVGGRTTKFDYKPGQLPPAANVLPDGQRVDFTYEPALDNQVLSILPAGEPANTFTFNPSLALPALSTGPLGTLAMTYTPSGKALKDTWTVGSETHTTTWRHTLNGLRQGFVDSHGSDHRYEYDRLGRLVKHLQDGVTSTFTFDSFSRVETITTSDASDALVQTLTYDSMGREHTRTFAATTAGSTRSYKQTLLYSDLDQVVNRAWEEGSSTGKETFDYDTRGRLITYTADAAFAPEDPFGNRVTRQVFRFNLLDGYEQVDSTFADGSTDTACFFYGNPEDPTQLTRITHNHAKWPAEIVLTYDACGRVVGDSLGRKLSWDAQDRLTRVEYNGQTCDYRYDPSGTLTDRILGTTLTRSFYSGALLTHEQTGSDVLQRIGDADTLFALNRITAGVRTVTLLGCDAQGSVRLEADNSVRTRHYTAHGAETADPDNGPYGYTGERREPLTDWYIPDGYRPYDPVVMGFLSSDSESPFGRGGLNPYTYCGGDPVNRIDPDGHAWGDWVKLAIGFAAGVVGTAMSFGALAPIAAAGLSALTLSGALSVVSATLGVVSAASSTSAAIISMIDKDSKAIGVLGDISSITGAASTLVGGGAKWLDNIAAKKLAKLAAAGGDALGGAGATSQQALNSAPGSPSLTRSVASNSPRPSITSADLRALNSTGNSYNDPPGIEMIEMQTFNRSSSATTVTDIGPRLNAQVSNLRQASSTNATPVLPAGQDSTSVMTPRVAKVVKGPGGDLTGRDLRSFDRSSQLRKAMPRQFKPRGLDQG